MTEENFDSPNCLAITDAKAAAFLVSPQGQRFLTPFLGAERTVLGAAQVLGISTNSLLYRVKQMVALGLLKVVREEARPGRALKIYRSTADAFFVPFELTSAETLQDLFLPMEAHWQAAFSRNSAEALLEHSPNLGLQLWRGESGELYVKPAAEAGLLEFTDLPLFAFWSAALYLDAEQAQGLKRELLEVYGRYAAASTSTQPKQRYISHLALAPWVLEEPPG